MLQKPVAAMPAVNKTKRARGNHPDRLTVAWNGNAAFAKWLREQASAAGLSLAGYIEAVLAEWVASKK